MNSPTSTMPTPSAQTWTGPRTLSRSMRLGATAPAASTLMASPGRHAPAVRRRLRASSAAAPREALADLEGIPQHPQEDRRRDDPGGVAGDRPEIHVPSPLAPVNRTFRR